MVHEKKSCPFCASENLDVRVDLHNWMVCCKDCGSKGPWGDNEDESVKLWNQRNKIVRTKVGKQTTGITCDFCKGEGWIRDEGGRPCNKCNGHGYETKWICQSGHVTFAFDDIYNDPRFICPACKKEN